MAQQKLAVVVVKYADGSSEMPLVGQLSDTIPQVRELFGTYGLRNEAQAEKLVSSDPIDPNAPEVVSVIVASSETDGRAVFAGDEPTEAQIAAVELEYRTRNDREAAREVANLGARDFDPDSVPAETDRSINATVRTAQYRFRRELMKEGDCCWLTEASIYNASHIRPWSVSDNLARVDPANGLLLSPNYDKLFDRHLISFAADGAMVVSPALNEKDREALRVDASLRLERPLLTSGRQKFLAEHLAQLQ